MKTRISSSNLKSETNFLDLCDSNRRSGYNVTCYSRFCNDVFNKRNLICCTKCRKFYHSSCISRHLIYEIIIRYPWHCDRCKYCVNCKDIKDKDKILLMCDSCDRGFHMDCVSETVTEVPDGKWFCDDCRCCKSCDLILSDRDANVNYYSLEGNKLCKRCMNERNSSKGYNNYKDYCSVCSKKINSNRILNNDIVICKRCTRGSHIKCSIKEDNSYLKSEIESWICNICYKIQISQVCFD